MVLRGESSSLSKDDAQREEKIKRICRAQLVSYRQVSSASYFWSYKFENCTSSGGWCFNEVYKEYMSTYNAYGLTLS